MRADCEQRNGDLAVTPRPGPAVYWFWSRIPTAAEAERQVRQIAGAGFDTVMIQARLSFARERYLSPDHLRGYRTAAQAAAAAGLAIHVYDDYNWISGHGGGRTVEGADELRERHLFWASSVPGATPAGATVSGIHSDWIDGLGPAGARWVYESGERRWDEWELVAAVAHPRGELAPADAVEVTGWGSVAGGPDGCSMSLDGAAPVPAGWVVTFFAAARCASSRLINYLDPRAAQRFLQVAYGPYLEALDGLVGDSVRGFSFDHPYGGFYQWREREGPVLNSLMWDPAAHLLDGDPELSPAQLLLAVVGDLGPATVGPRCRFFSAYAARGIESFFGTLCAWTREHGVGLTGHELLGHVGGWDLYGAFPELDVRTNFGGDYFGVDRARTETLVDASNFSAQLSPIMGDSVARAHGRARCTIEQYAARREPPEDYAAGYWELSLPELRLQAMRLHVLGARRFLFHAFGQSDGSDEDHELLSNPRFDFPPTCNFEPWFDHFPSFAAESAAVSAFIEGGEPIRDVALVYPLHTLWAHGQSHPHGPLFGAWAQRLAREGVGFDVVDDRALDGAEIDDGRAWLAGRGYRAVVLPGVAVLPSRRGAELLEALVAVGGAVVASQPLPQATAAGVDPDLSRRIGVVCEVADPSRVPTTIRARDTAPPIDPGDGDGTLWRWCGRDADGLRIVLLNDGPARRRVTIAAGAAVELEPEEITCLRLAGDPASPEIVRAPDGPSVPPPADDAPASSLAATLRDGWTLEVPGERPVAIDPDRGWEQQGFETFAGAATYRCRFDRPAGAAEDRWMLTLPVVHCCVRAALNGTGLGARGWPPYRFEIPAGELRALGNELALEVTNSAANRYYAGTPFQHGLQPSGLAGAPVLDRRRAA